MEHPTLASLFPGQWEEGWPARLSDLVSADWDSLSGTARGLRALAVHLVHGFERAPVLNARAAMRLLEQHHLPARKGKWTAIALNAERERVYAKSEGGTLRQVHMVSSGIPKAADLARKAPLPADGAYLVVGGGSPQMLHDPGALDGYRALKAAMPIVDLVLWDTDGPSAAFWSVAAGAGRRDALTCPWPDEHLLRAWQGP